MNKFQKLLSLAKSILFKNNKWRSFHEFHQNKDVVVIANGPSMNEDLEKNKNNFIGMDYICVNNFVFTEYYEIIKPKYYAIYDSLYWEWGEASAGELMKKYADPINLIYYKELNHRMTKFYELLNSKTNWPLKLFVPGYAFSIVNKKISNKKIQLVPVLPLPLNLYNSNIRNYLYKKRVLMPHPQTVVIFAIYNALQLCDKNVFIIGADHSWHEDIFLDSDNLLWLRITSLGENKSVLAMRDIFNNKRDSMENMFISLHRVFKSHSIMNSYSSYIGKKIINFSGKTWIDAYDRRIK
jgi:hypothetical protein